MNYRNFIEDLEKCLVGTARITTFSWADRFSLNRVPRAFSLTFPSIISVLKGNIENVCKNKKQIMVIFNMQPAGMAICDYKKSYNPSRVIDPRNKEFHFCCFLNYMLLQKVELGMITTRDHTQNVVINFTTGEIMDMQQYFFNIYSHKFKNYDKPGIVYGNIEEFQLNMAWTHFNTTSKGEPYGMPIY